MASTETVTYQESFDSQYLSSSLSHLSRSRTTNSLIVRAYKQSTQFYLTKRFKEALETLEPIIRAQHSSSADQTNNHLASEESGPAPVAQSSKGTRTKVWVFYLSLLHAIIELGPDEGKLVFGATRWRQLAAKARDGTIWEEVVQRGYGGNEGEIDPEVVVNLTTLLLGHMHGNQKLNQQRLETYLSASAGGPISMAQDGIATPMSNGTSTPRDLTTRLKILELYALHVLPANDEWDYAREFIEMSDLLDEERREAFLHALQSLKDEKDGTLQREQELQEMREREMQEQRAAEEQKRKDEERREDERRKAAELQRQPITNGHASGTPSRPLNGHTPKVPKSPIHPQSSTPSKPQKKPPSPPATLYSRASAMLSHLQSMIVQAGSSMTGNSVVLMRLLMFTIAFLIILSRRDLRLKLKRTWDDSWMKLKQTVGMGLRVSYM